MDILGVALQGMNQAQGRFEKAAQQIAQVAMPSQTPGDSVSLSDNAVSLLSAKNQFEADLGVAQTASEMQKKTLDLLA